MAVMACEAGKDVYVEKPACLTIEEGRAMVQAAERYGRVVQVGAQGRSTARRLACLLLYPQRPDRRRAPRHVLALRQPRPATGRRIPPPPPALDYETWLGPARYIPYNAKHTHGSFRWLLDFGGGPDPRSRRAHHEHRAMDYERRIIPVR